MITFRFLMKGDHVPQSIRSRMTAPVAEADRKNYGERRAILPSTPNCVFDPYNLIDSGYELVDVLCHKRPVGQNQKADTVVIFRFAQRDDRKVSADFRQVQAQLNNQFFELCREAYWQLDAHANPYFQNGVPIEGQLAISVNLNQRVPRFKPNGDPELKWHRDGTGEKIGDGPVPIWPDYKLRLQETGVPMLEPVEE